MAVPLAMEMVPRRRQIMTASAMQLEPRDTEMRRRRNLPWQRRAFENIRLVPELGYASGFYAKMMKKVRLYPAIRKQDETLTAITSGLPVELLDRIQDPGGGRSQIQGSYGKLMFISGDGYLLGRSLDSDDERWSFININELDRTDGGFLWQPNKHGDKQFLPAQTTVAYRMWTPDPEHSGDAWSPMLAIEEVAEELVILTRAVRSTAVTRMLNGILKIPSELSFGADEPGMDEDPEANKFLEDIIDHITGVIENAGSAEAASPFMAEGAAEFLAQLEWIKTHDPATDYMEQGLRTEAVKRLSLGLDMPPEVLMGLANANHWVGRQIMLEQWRSHGSPVAEQFADDLSESYLRPALRDAGYPDWKQVVIGVDDSQVVVSPDRSADADQAKDRGAIGDKGYRKLKGIPEDYAPTDLETRIYLAVKMRDASFLIGTPFEVPTQVAKQTGPTPDPTNERPVGDGPAEPNRNGSSSDVSRSESPNSYEIKGAARLAILRCREVAGSRLRSQYKTKIAPLVDGQPNSQVASILGIARVHELGQDEFKLVASGTDGFMTILLNMGYTKATAESLSEMLTVHAGKTLYEPQLPELSQGFLAQVERMQEVSECLT